MKTLEQLYREHEGKVSDKWSLYLAEYDRLFAPYQGQSICLLEIGIQNGGSLEIWSKFFPHAEKLVGCDINPNCARLQYDDPRICLVLADANTDEAQQQIFAHSPRFDLIIDDGSHRSGDIVRSFARYFPYLEYGGLYLVEDLHCSYWKEFTGGLFHPDSSMTFFKRLADVVNHEHWGIDKARSEFLYSFEQRCGINFREGLLREIHSVEFLNSLCIVKKQKARDNALGIRVIAGTSEIVQSGFRALHGKLSTALDQRQNKWAARDVPTEKELLRAEVARLQEEVSSGGHEISRLKKEVSEQATREGALREQLAAAEAALGERNQRMQYLQQASADLEGQLVRVKIETSTTIAELTTALGGVEVRRVEVLRGLISELSSLSSAFEASETWRIAKALQRLKVRPTGDPVRQLLHRCSQVSQYLAAKNGAVDGIWLREPVSAARWCVEALLLSPTVRISRVMISLGTCAQLRLPGPGALERMIGIAEALGQIMDFGSDPIGSTKSSRVSQGSSARPEGAAQGSQGDVAERDLQQIEQALTVQPRAGSSLPEKLKEIEASGLFDREWYLAQYPHVESTSMDPVAHYLCHGAAEGLNPSPLFNTPIYVAAHRNRVHPNDALLHFHRSGAEAAPGAYRTPDVLMEIQRRYQANTEMRCLMDRRSRERRFMVYLQCGAGSVHQQWLTKGARQWELIVNHYDGTYVSRVSCDVEFQQVGRLPGTKFTSFLNLISNWPDAVRQYDAILLLDDDVLISEEDIATLFNIVESRSLDLAQASLTTDSDCAHPVCRRRNTHGVRYVNTVDLTMPILSQRSIEVGRHLFGQTVSGWGLDMVLGSLVSERLGGKAAVVDSVVARHSKSIDTEDGAFYRMLHRAHIYPEIELAHLQRLYGVGRNIFEIAVP